MYSQYIIRNQLLERKGRLGYEAFSYNIQTEEKTKLTSKTCCSTVLPSVPDLPPMNARYLMSIFVVSVLPAPLSPLTRIDWLPCSFIIALVNGTSHFILFSYQ